MHRIDSALRNGFIFFVSAALGVPGAVADDRPLRLDGTKLYLGAGTIDTRQLENLRAAPPGGFEADLLPDKQSCSFTGTDWSSKA